ncbi:MAG: DUF3800 domain-containing protein [Thermoguttaceae bacterium]|nr:DUF3800 domain-containing protein [Thermoguttaceae bacterium]
MSTRIVYFDETGDDGASTSSSDTFVLSSLYMDTKVWQENFNRIRECRKELKERFGFHTSEEIHTAHLVRDKGIYRKYGWNETQRQEILIRFTQCIASLQARAINVVIDKTRFTDENYPVLKNALKYSIQRIENDSAGKWNYLIITDKGRLAPMMKTAREIRVFNPIPSHFGTPQNTPIQGLVEDILEKESSESYFIQICDFISFFVHLYYRTWKRSEPMPNRVGKIIPKEFSARVLETLKQYGILNLEAAAADPYGLVIYPKRKPAVWA